MGVNSSAIIRRGNNSGLDESDSRELSLVRMAAKLALRVALLAHGMQTGREIRFSLLPSIEKIDLELAFYCLVHERRSSRLTFSFSHWIPSYVELLRSLELLLVATRNNILSAC